MNDLHLIYRKERERITISGTRRGKNERGEGVYHAAHDVMVMGSFIFIFGYMPCHVLHIHTWSRMRLLAGWGRRWGWGWDGNEDLFFFCFLYGGMDDG